MLIRRFTGWTLRSVVGPVFGLFLFASLFSDLLNWLDTGYDSPCAPQLDSFLATRDECEGRGLGLHLSRRIAQDCGGELRYEPRPGGGARFVMEIPAMGLAA